MLPARFIKPVAYRLTLTCEWGTDCFDSKETKTEGPHYAEKHIDYPMFHAENIVEASSQIGVEPGFFPNICHSCGVAAPEDANRAHFFGYLYDTDTMMPEPGDLYFWEHDEGNCPAEWMPCNGAHLIAVLPDGSERDLDGRDPRCAAPENSLHRCWIRKGDPPYLTVSKQGRTCGEGAGGITGSDWFGYLRNGYFQQG
jgi:hypothetical protein